MADWVDLPEELLRQVSERLTTNIDYIRFRAVCVSWRDATAGMSHRLPCQNPLLMIPHEVNSKMQGFFSLSSNKVFHIELPETRQKRCCGSSQGWLALVDKTPAILLFNPLTKSQVHLPPLTTFPDVVKYQPKRKGKEYDIRVWWADEGEENLWTATSVRDLFIKKMILSSSPASGADSAVLAIVGLSTKLAFCRPGDKTWTIMDRTCPYYDVTYHKGQFYTIDHLGRVGICDVTASAKIKPILDINIWIGSPKYLVESAGDLLLVVRHDEPEKVWYRTSGFDVYKLDLSGQPNCTKVESLDGRALFLGQNHSMSFSAADFPGCRGNCIYFTDDYQERHVHGHIGGHDLGVFNMEDGTVEPVPCYPANATLIWPPPTWFTPSLY